jgi:hypothetical protein
VVDRLTYPELKRTARNNSVPEFRTFLRHLDKVQIALLKWCFIFQKDPLSHLKRIGGKHEVALHSERPDFMKPGGHAQGTKFLESIFFSRAKQTCNTIVVGQLFSIYSILTYLFVRDPNRW